MTGDGTHGWATNATYDYLVNGADKDTHTELHYTIAALVYQALHEDGLIPRGEFCSPAYVFNQEDDQVYYIKNESEDRGLYTSYLVDNNGTLKWETISAADVTSTAKAGWYITFNPENQYYTFRNKSTGQYLYYNNGFRTNTTATEMHLMKSRIDVSLGGTDIAYTGRGYWIIYPSCTSNPPTLTANASGAIGSSNFDLTNGATTQRWLILTAEEATDFDANELKKAALQLVFDDVREKGRAKIDNTQTNGASALNTLESTLTTLETNAGNETNLTTTKINNYTQQAYQALSTAFQTAGGVYDLTDWLINPDMETTDAGWTKSNMNYQGWHSSFNYNRLNTQFMETWVGTDNTLNNASAEQTISYMPQGYYEFTANVIACRQNADNPADIGNNVVLYIQNPTTASTSCTSGNHSPEQNTVGYNLTSMGDLTVGLNISSSTSANWVAWDDARLIFRPKANAYLNDTLADRNAAELASHRQEVTKGDITHLIVDPTFNITATDGIHGWQNYRASYQNTMARNWKSGSVRDAFIENTDPGAIYQILSNMPAGTYKFVIAVRGNSDGAIMTPFINNNIGTAITTVGDTDLDEPIAQINLNGVEMPYNSDFGFTTNANGKNWVWASATCTLSTTGNLKFGVHTNGNAWMAIDDAHLYYMSDTNGNTCCEAINVSDASTTTYTTNGKVVTADIKLANPNTLVRSAQRITAASGYPMHNNTYGSNYAICPFSNSGQSLNCWGGMGLGNDVKVYDSNDANAPMAFAFPALTSAAALGLASIAALAQASSCASSFTWAAPELSSNFLILSLIISSFI